MSLYRGYIRALVSIAMRLVETNTVRPLPLARETASDHDVRTGGLMGHRCFFFFSF